MSTPERVSEARALVQAAGFPRADVEIAGHDGTIAVVVNVSPADAPALARLAPGIRALGFRYVTIDITPPPA